MLGFIRKYKGWIAVIITAFFILTMLAPAFSMTELERKQAELARINKQLQQNQQKFTAVKKEESKVLNQLKDLEQQIDNVEKDINYLGKELVYATSNVQLAEEDLVLNQKEIDQRNQYFNQRLREIYMQGDVNYLELLLNSTSMGDLLSRYDFLQKIAEKDVNLLDELKQLRQGLEAKKTELIRKRDYLNQVKTTREDTQRTLSIQSTRKEELLTSLQKEKQSYIKAIDELEESQEEMDALIRKLQAESKRKYMGSGKLAWPTPNYYRVTSPFGYRIHPIFKTKRFHPAIDIGAPSGATVIAAENGVVIFTGWKGGYGQAIILDHGGNISTQYSHLSSIKVSVGQEVKRGQTIGAVGSTGWSTGPHLDFIVRKNGEPENPMNYLNK